MREPATQDARRSALVADDDEFFRMAIRSILTDRLDMTDVIETASLDAALEELGERPAVQIALFDLFMPGMESPASLGAVRELFPETLVAVVSSSTRRGDILKALDAGVHGYVPKGLGIDELTSALQLVLDGMIYVPPSLAELPPPRDERVAHETGGPVVPAQAALLAGLTPRQQDVLRLLVAGKSNKEIARILQLGEGTIKVHLAALFRNLGVNNRAAAAVAGARLLSGDQ